MVQNDGNALLERVFLTSEGTRQEGFALESNGGLYVPVIIGFGS